MRLQSSSSGATSWERTTGADAILWAPCGVWPLAVWFPSVCGP